MKFSDTHFHIESIAEAEGIILNSFASDVKLLVVSCCDKKSIEDSQEIGKYDGLYFSYGFHPDSADKIDLKDIEWLKEQIIRKQAIAVGEIGLDYHYGKINEEKQKRIFKKQLDLAKEFNLPVVIHSRDATEDTLKILKEYDLRGVIHCFSGSIETAREYIKLGYYLGIGGILTFKNSKLKDVVKEIGLDKLVLETDSPYLAPEPHRGKVNSPCNIPLIAATLGEIFNVSLEEVADKTYKNACMLFDLPN